MPKDPQAAVLDRERLGSIGAMGGEVGPVDHAAGRGDGGREALSEIASIERVGAVAGDGPERHGEIGLLEHLARAGPASSGSEELRRLVVKGETPSLLDDRIGEHVAHRETAFGVSDRGSESAIEAEAALVGNEVGDPRKQPGHGGDGRALRRETRSEGVGVKPMRRGSRAVVHGDLAGFRVVREREHVAAHRRAVGHDHGAHGGRGGRGIGRAAALAQGGQAGGRCEVMSARDQTIGSSDRWASGHLRSMVLKGRMRSRHARPELRPRR